MQLILRLQKMGAKTPVVEHLLDPGYELGEVEELINEALDERVSVLLTPRVGTTDIQFYPHQMKLINVAVSTIDPETL